MQDALRAHKADAAVVVAYGLILPKPALDAPRLGCFNVHASLLPRWRGAAPINRAIMAGDKDSGVTVMKMDEGLDTGAMAMSERVTIGADMTAGELHDVLARRGADLMVRALAALERGTLTLTPQPEAGVTYAAKIDKGETRIDWSQAGKRRARPHPRAVAVSRRLVRARRRARQGPALDQGRGSRGAPGTALDDKLTIACGAGAVRLTQVQRAGKQAMSADDFLRGTPVKARHESHLTCRATSSSSNMTARPLPAGRSRPTRKPCRAC